MADKSEKHDGAGETVHISYQLIGEDARRFNEYKRAAYLRNNSEAARKLMFERLAQVEKEHPEHAHA